ncbi:MAG: cysteine--tRNA ligase [Candidatus Paceibacterota bacterium]
MLKILNIKKEYELYSPSRKEIGLYSCGPTVYNDITIGNWRTYYLTDIVYRTLTVGYPQNEVKFITNITDVGHLTGDNLGDADQGEDRLEKEAKKLSKSAWDISTHYSDKFIKERRLLNLKNPQKFTKATEYIKEQINLIEKIDKNGFVYSIPNDGLYFDVQKYEKSGFEYYVLTEKEKIAQNIAQSRIDVNKNKKDLRDFALWKFSKPEDRRHMEWDSPWGRGFPGWHIECSAMSIKYLGQTFDFHIGGEDLKDVHHQNEIAQAQAASLKKNFVKYWLHGAFLLVDGGKMSKSLGNAYCLDDLKKRNIYVLSIRYLFSQTSYKKQLNFTWKSLESAQNSLLNLYNKAVDLSRKAKKNNQVGSVRIFEERIFPFILNDFDIPTALGELWKIIKDESISEQDRLDALMESDEIFGFNIKEFCEKSEEINKDPAMKDILHRRSLAKNVKNWEEADKLKKEIFTKGYVVQDSEEESFLIPRMD